MLDTAQKKLDVKLVKQVKNNKPKITLSIAQAILLQSLKVLSTFLKVAGFGAKPQLLNNFQKRRTLYDKKAITSGGKRKTSLQIA